MNVIRWMARAALAAGLIALSSGTGHAGLVVTVGLDTSALDPTKQYTLAFDLIDGDGTVNNSAVISNFDLGGGSLVGTASTIGGGSVTSADPLVVTLADTDFFNSVEQAFTPGSTLSFTLELSASFPGGIPDGFALTLLDEMGLPLGTGLAGELLFAAIASNTPNALVIETFGGVDPETGTPLFAAPTVTPSTVIPEPSTLAMAALASAFGLAMRARRRHRCRAA